MRKFFSKMKKYIISHKFISSIIIIILVIGGYYTYKKVFAASVLPQYVLAPVSRGSIKQTVTGSGQVSSENQLDITSEVSGKVVSISAKVGQTVKAGDLIATLDAHDALVDLKNAQISFSKLTEPAKPGDIESAQNNLTKAYSDSFSTINSTYTDFPNVMSGLKDLFYGKTGYLNNYQNTISQTGKDYRDLAATSYEKANSDYEAILVDYKNLTKNSSTDVINDILTKTSDFTKEISQVLKNTQAAITFISASQPEYNPSSASSASANVNSWSSEINGDLSSLLSAKNSIANDIDTLNKLLEGPDKLDLESQQISLSEKQRAYQKYFIKAPFDGIVGRIPINVYDQVGGGTVVATLSSNQKITNIALNEVDAVKVSAGQNVELTFDAIEGLTISGTVAQVDLVGTASQGVVTYNVKISFNGDDPRIRPGMSVDATITTEEKDNVLVVPASAIKTQGSINYVELFNDANSATTTFSTRQRTGGNFGQNASSTRNYYRGTTTRNISGNTNSPSGITRTQNRTTTISSATAPQRQIVQIGASDDTNIEILSGLQEGQEIVVRTIAASATPSQSTAPSIFGSLGGNQRGAIQGATRVTGGAANRTFSR